MSEVKVSNQLKENYESYYDDEDAEWRRLGSVEKAANIVAMCNGLPLRTVLDIGAGEGSILQRLSELEFADQLYAVEISSSGIERILARQIPRLVEAKLFDGYTIPFGDATFDVAVLSHVLEHVEFPRQLVYEAARVARYVVVEVPLEDTNRLAFDFKFDRVGHINHWSPRTIRWLLQSSRLRVLKQVVTNPSKAGYVYLAGRRGLRNYYVKQALLNLLPNLATRHFAYHCTLLCESDV